MTKVAFVSDIIKRTPDYPFTKPISLESAQFLLDNTRPECKPADLTAEEVVKLWNKLINDQKVME